MSQLYDSEEMHALGMLQVYWRIVWYLLAFLDPKLCGQPQDFQSCGVHVLICISLILLLLHRLIYQRKLFLRMMDLVSNADAFPLNRPFDFCLKSQVLAVDRKCR